MELCKDHAITDPAIYHKIDTPFCEVPEGQKYRPVITHTPLGEPLGEQVVLSCVDWSNDELMVKLEIDLDRSVENRDFRRTDYDAPSRLLARILRHQGPLPLKPTWVGKMAGRWTPEETCTCRPCWSYLSTS